MVVIALAETARLIASLELQDKFSSTIKTVEGKLDGVGTKLDGIGTKAKTKFGQLRDAARDTNTQTSAVNLALNGIEQFVPPSIRPLVDGLETLNNTSPKGLLALINSGLTTGKTITLKLLEDITTNAQGILTKLTTALTTAGFVPGAGGVKGNAATVLNLLGKITIVGLAAEIASAIEDPITQISIDIHKQLGLPDLDPSELQWPFGPKNTPDFSLGPFGSIFGGDSGSPTAPAVGGGGRPVSNFSSLLDPGEGNTSDLGSAFQLLGQRSSAAPLTMKWRPADVMQIEDRRAEGRNAAVLEHLESNRLATLNAKPPQVNITVKTNVFGTTATTTTTYNRFVPSIAGLLP